MVSILDRWRSRDGRGRKFRRIDLPVAAELIVYGQRCPCRIVNITPGGACVDTVDRIRLAEGGRVEFDLQDYGRLPARICYVVSRGIGLEFMIDRKALEALAAWLGPPPASR